MEPGTDSSDISPTLDSPWQPGSTLAGVFVDRNDAPYRIYYADPDGSAVASFWLDSKKEEENSWVERKDGSWGNATGGMAAVSWPNQIRLYYFQDGQLTMSAQSDEVWDEPQSID